EMKRPGCADHGIEQAPVRLHIVKNAEHAVGGDGENAVDRKKIGRERDEEVVPIGHNMAAVPADTKTADAAAHEQYPKRVGQFVAEYVNNDRARQTKKCYQTKHRA